MVRDIISIAVLVVCLLLVAPALADVPVPAVPTGHPRVYLRPDDVNDIQAKVLLPEFQSEWAGIKANASSEAPSAALVYLIEGNTTRGEEAIDDALTAIQASTDARTFGSEMHWAACVYDWCYPLLTTSEKTTFITEFKRIADLHQPYYPAELGYNAVVGHNAEGWLLTAQLPAGVAIYDEDTSMYDAAAQLFFQKYISPRDWLYDSHAYHQGDSYLSRFLHDIASAWLFRRMGAGDVFSSEQQFMPYCAIYNQRPDGKQIRRGDTYDAKGASGSKQPIFMLTGTYYQEPYLMTMTDDDWFTKYYSTDILRPMQMIFRAPNLSKNPISQLPLTKYFAHPMGEMTARTGWELDIDSDNAVVFMRIGGTHFLGHQSRDMGTFQIYYKGPLAVNSGIYQSSDPTYPTSYGTEHWKNYYHQTLSHNGLLIFDPEEVPVDNYWRSVNDGGQRVPNNGTYPDTATVQTSTYKLGEVTSRQFGPNTMTPEYSYISGDITNAYTDKVSEVTRSMVTLNLDDVNYPSSLIAYDRITSVDPTFKKTWLIHSIQEPNVDANTITIVRDEGDYAGKLVTESILPAGPNITKIGGPGYQFWVEDSSTNYMVVPDKADEEPGAWRVEVSPSSDQAQDFFLHVMTVMDDTQTNGPTIESITNNNDVVVTRLLDRAVVFGRQSTLLSTASFKVPGTGTTKILVCDLKAGVWSVSRGDVTVESGLQATDEGNCIYFEGPTGLDAEYLLTVTDADFDSDGDVDVNDLSFFVGQWLSDTPQVHPVTGKSPDLYGDSMINFVDFSMFAQRWQDGVGPPTPDPMTWATVPYATGSSSISMTVTTAYDPVGVEYYFACTAGGGNDSSWQDSVDYQDIGLDSDTPYTYQVKARDKSPYQNQTAYSTAASATTIDAITSIVAFYEFEGNYNDTMGGPTGTPAGHAAIVYDSDRGSNVLRVDGSGDYVRFGNDSVSGITDTITVACWVKTSTLPSLDSLVTKGYAWRLAGDSAGSGPTSFVVSGLTSLEGTVDVNDGTWHHVAAVYDGAKTYLYVDGDPDTSVANTGSLNTTNLYIFAAGALLKEYGDGSPYSGFPKYHLNGRLDDVRVYDQALSPAQIQTLASQ